MNVAIIDYGSGNLRSVAKAFERVAGNASVIQVTRDPEALAAASHIVLPGVGAFADCMQGLRALPGMLAALQEQVITQRKQFLGICVGMQMLFEQGHEHGVHAGLGWLKGEVVALKPDDASLKIPHMGWNDLYIPSPAGGRLGGGHSGTIEQGGPHPNPPPVGEGINARHPLLKGIKDGDHAYFVHSYHARCADAADILATVDYGQTVTAVVGRGNIMGTQFHPEKSQATGLALIGNFLSL